MPAIVPQLGRHRGQATESSKSAVLLGLLAFWQAQYAQTGSQRSGTIPARKRRFHKWQKKARKERKSKLIELLGGCCQICGYDRPCAAAYDFHHLDPATKRFGLACYGLLRGWQEVLEEAVKCVLLCRRCHAELHAGFHPGIRLRLIVQQPVFVGLAARKDSTKRLYVNKEAVARTAIEEGLTRNPGDATGPTKSGQP